MTTKRNIVEGIEHMGSFYRALPEIARFIEADYDEKGLKKANHDFLNRPEPDEAFPDDDDKDVYPENWISKRY